MAAAALGADELSDSGEGGCRSLLPPAALTTLLFALLLGLLPPRSVPITPIDVQRERRTESTETRRSRSSKIVHKVVDSFPFPACSQVFSLNERVTSRKKEVPTKGRQLHVTAAHVNVVHVHDVRFVCCVALVFEFCASFEVMHARNLKPSKDTT